MRTIPYVAVCAMFTLWVAAYLASMDAGVQVSVDLSDTQAWRDRRIVLFRGTIHFMTLEMSRPVDQRKPVEGSRWHFGVAQYIGWYGPGDPGPRGFRFRTTSSDGRGCTTSDDCLSLWYALPIPILCSVALWLRRYHVEKPRSKSTEP